MVRRLGTYFRPGFYSGFYALAIAVALVGCRGGQPEQAGGPSHGGAILPTVSPTAHLAVTPRPPSVGGAGEAAGRDATAGTAGERATPAVTAEATASAALQVEREPERTPPALITPTVQAPAPTVVVTTAPAHAPPSDTPLRALLAASSWPSWAWSTVEAIVACESGGDQTQTGRAGERGLMQVHPVHAGPGGLVAQLGYTWAQMYQAGPNLEVAYALYLVQGWGAWRACA